MSLPLQHQWQQLCAGYTQDALLVARLWQELEGAYSGSGRHYHNLQHLSKLLALANEYGNRLLQPDWLRFAIFYHDVVYTPFRKDNEEKSAALAVVRLQQLGLGIPAQQNVQEMILATKTHSETEDSDTRLLLDFDLSILAALPEQYQHYSRQVRQEYRLVPYFLYRKGRKKVLQHFLDKPHIYQTPLLARQWEAAARQNLQQELDQFR